jgi:hypothetical protein
MAKLLMLLICVSCGSASFSSVVCVVGWVVSGVEPEPCASWVEGRQ